MKEKLKPIIMYLSYFLAIAGIVIMMYMPNTLGKMDGDSIGFGFILMFVGMCLWWIILFAVKFDWFEDAEFLNYKTIMWIGLITSGLLIAFQLYFRIDYSFYGFFSFPGIIPGFKYLENEPMYIIFTIINVLLTGLFGFCFFSLRFCDGDDVGYEYVTVTTYYNDNGFAYDQKTSNSSIAVGGYILVGLLTSIIPFLVSFTPFMILVFFYFLLHIVKHKNKKRLIWKMFFCILVGVLCISTTIASSFGVDYNIPTNAHFIYEEEEGNYTIVGVKNYSNATRLIIPEEYFGKKITKIDNDAFSECKKINYAEVPSWASSYVPYTTKELVVTSGSYIDDNAFVKYDFEKITLHSNLKTIGNNAFSKCDNLTEVIIPEGVISIGDYAFSECNNLKYVTIPESLTSVGYGAFSLCDLLEYNIYNNASYLGNDELKYMLLCEVNELDSTSFSIPKETKFIHSEAFDSFKSLEEVIFDIDSELVSIGNRAFINCNSLKKFEIPENVTYIGNDAFSNCTSLTSITIPQGVSCIYAYSFSDCDMLSSIIIPTSVKTINVHSFDNSELLNIYYEGSQSEWLNIKFEGNSRFDEKRYPDGTKYFYSEEEPTDKGEYWHYADDGKTPIIWE